MKKIITLCILLLAFLVGCNNNENLNNDPNLNITVVNPPTYKEMYLSEEETKVTNKTLSLTTDTLDIPNDVVVSEEQVDHFAKPDQDFYLHILLENKEAYEIMSVTIDNVKYQSYQFQDNSTSEEIIIKMQAPSLPGPYTYRITGIKYVYGSNILDVDLTSSNPIIKLGVSEVRRPKFILKNLDIFKDYIMLDYLIDENLYLDGTYRFILMKDEEIITYYDTKSISDVVTFLNLEAGALYQVVVICYADFFDGQGVSSYLLHEEEYYSYSEASLTNILAYPTYITYELKKEDVITNLTITCNGQNVTNTTTITNLDPATEYILILSYICNQKNYTITYVVKTPTYSEPTLLDFNIEPNKTYISYNVNLLDADKVVFDFNVSLYDVFGNLIEVKEDLESNFSSLASNTIYEIKLSYKYYIDDNNYETYSTSKFVNTLAKTKPVVSPIFAAGSTEIYCYYEIFDPDNTIRSISILYEDSGGYLTPISRIDYTFKNLVANRTYNIYYIIYYDDNGSGDLKRLVNTYEVKTEPSNLQIDPEFKEIFETEAHLQFYFKYNNFSVEVEGIDLYQDGSLIAEYNKEDIIKNNDLYDVYFENLEPDTKYFCIINYKYNYYDGNGVNSYSHGIDFKTANRAPNLDITYQEVANGLAVNLAVTDNVKYDYRIVLAYIDGIEWPIETSPDSLSFILVGDTIPNKFELKIIINYTDSNYTYNIFYLFDVIL